jgi:hypothetical protein
MWRQTRKAGGWLFLISLCLAGAFAILVQRGFPGAPPADFTDFFLLCVLVLAYRDSWPLAAALTAVTVAISAFLLAPIDAGDTFQLISYAVCATLVIWIMASLRRRTHARP